MDGVGIMNVYKNIDGWMNEWLGKTTSKFVLNNLNKSVSWLLRFETLTTVQNISIFFVGVHSWFSLRK